MQFVNQKLKKKIDRLLEEMSLEQKAALCSGKTAWLTEDIEQLNLPSIRMADGPHGLRVVEKLALDSDQPATCFPTASALAASWDPDLIREVGAALGQESQALGVHILLGPGVNMKRTPRCGRNFEYFAEDPYLAGEMGVAFVRGVQSQGVGTSLKHFVANNQENRRFTINAEIDERTLREIYLLAFERVVKTAHPWTVMCAYNRINGTFASENDYLLSEILKKEWGFEGLVVSDWGAVDDRVRGIKAGLDLEMPGPSSVNDRRIVRAVESGELSESVLDGVVKRILRVVFKACNEEKQIEQLPLEENHRLARRAAANSCVLLKNEGDLLPLDFERINSLAVIGRMAEEPKFEGGG
ncbi:MAG: glycoside hydrolase family 3 N-terminal domain-containing protein, partial [Bacillota bacterium]